MKQVAQRPRDGDVLVIDVPVPQLRPGWVLVQNRYSLISAGTERSKVEMGQKSLLEKARARPDLVRSVVDKARKEGIRATMGAVNERLDGLEPLGYSSAGVVLEVGDGVIGLKPGDTVACGGGGWANHAEVVAVPRNLTAKVAPGTPLDQAAYATLGAIALHGLRQAESTVGDRVGVIGLGLVGQLAVRLLGSAGCVAVGIDLDPAAVSMAELGGAVGLLRDRPGLAEAVAAATDRIGLDAVLVCASAPTSDPVELAAELARERGTIVVLGSVEVAADRGVLYDKELELRLSRSYGPGRYDRDYEERGRDLPAAYVRWTQQRNLDAFVGLLAAGRLDVSDLTTHRFPLDEAADAYATLTQPRDRRPFGILIDYGEADGDPRVPARPASSTVVPRGSGVALVGAGSFARRILVPALRDAGARLVAVQSQGGLSAADLAGRAGFARTAGDLQELLDDPDVGGVVIATRHADHARLAAAALRSGKHVFVEKPLALAASEIDDVEAALSEGGAGLMVGFNRRFAPLIDELRDRLTEPPTLISIRVNAGPLPDDHWTHDLEDGGGRLAGEGCHFVDLICDLGGSPARRAHAVAGPRAGRTVEGLDDFVATLELANGTVGVLTYTASGSPRFPKERIEVFGGGTVAVVDDFRRLEIHSSGRRHVSKSRQDKGHRAQMQRFVDVVEGRRPPEPAEGYLHASRVTLALLDSLRTGAPVSMHPSGPLGSGTNG